MTGGIFLLITAAAAYYVSAMLHLWFFAGLAAAEVLVFLAAVGFSAYASRKLDISSETSERFIQKGKQHNIELIVSNRGRLPLRKVCVTLKYGYPHGEKAYKTLLYTSVPPRSECKLDFDIAAEYCGRLYISTVSAKVYDPFSLFALKASKRRTGITAHVSVLPNFSAVNTYSETVGGIARGSDDELPNPTSLGGGDIAQLREYQEGDPVRLIHRNISARTGEIWVKELEGDSNASTRLYLKAANGFTPTLRSADRFYEAVYGVVSGLLHRSSEVLVCRGESETCVKSSGGICTLIQELYLDDFAFKTNIESDDVYQSGVLTLTTAAELYRE